MSVTQSGTVWKEMGLLIISSLKLDMDCLSLNKSEAFLEMPISSGLFPSLVFQNWGLHRKYTNTTWENTFLPIQFIYHFTNTARSIHPLISISLFSNQEGHEKEKKRSKTFPNLLFRIVVISCGHMAVTWLLYFTSHYHQSYI